MKSNGIWIDLILNIFSNNTVIHYDAQKLILIKYLNGCFLQANQHKITQLCYVNLILIHLFLPQLKINNVGVMFVFNFLLLCQRSHLITVRCSTIYCKQTKSMNKALLWHIKTDHSDGPLLSTSFDPMSLSEWSSTWTTNIAQLSEDRGLCVPQGLGQNTISPSSLQYLLNTW